MSFQSQIITIFISSPSDVSGDRKIVLDEIQAWNQRNARSKKCFLFALTWEDLVAPDLSDSGQEVINLEVGDDYDVFLGLMWARFGTPTSRADSGTQEEFERALGRKKSVEALRISFFFRNSEISIDEVEPEQLARVRTFKSDLSNKGAFYGQYANDRELTSGLTTLFDRIANEKSRYSAPPKTNSSDSSLDLVSIKPDSSNAEVVDHEAGFFDLEDALNREARGLVDLLAEWSEQYSEMNKIVEAVSGRINELSQFGQPDRTEIRKQIDIVTAAMSSFSNFANNRIGLIEDQFESIYKTISGLLEVMKDFDDTGDKRGEMKNQIADLSKNTQDAEAAMTQYIEVMIGLPRIDKNFNRSRDSVVIVHKRLRKKTRDFISRLSQLSD